MVRSSQYGRYSGYLRETSRTATGFDFRRVFLAKRYIGGLKRFPNLLDRRRDVAPLVVQKISPGVVQPPVQIAPFACISIPIPAQAESEHSLYPFFPQRPSALGKHPERATTAAAVYDKER